MRGKIGLFVILLSVAMASMAIAQNVSAVSYPTILRVEPSYVTGPLPGDKFTVSITVQDVTDLWAFGFKLGYRSGTRVLGAISATAGDFLTVYGMGTYYFAYTIDVLHGYIDVGCTLTNAMLPGVSGNGTLAEIEFVVVEAGDSPLDLYDVKLLDSNLDAIGAQKPRDGFFDGPNVELIRANIGARSKKVGEMQEFDIKVQNEGTVPLYARARIDNVRLEDGLTTTLYAGQEYVFPPVRDPEYLYVDGYDATRQQWTEVGASPFLGAAGDGNYIEGTTDGAQHRWFSFEDIAVEGAIIDYVELEGYCDGPYNEGVDFDVYNTDFNWLGSLYATGAGPEWVTPRWLDPGETASDIVPALLTEEGLNDFQVLVYFYDPGAAGGPGNIVDSIRLHVVFAAGRAPDYPAVDGYDATRQQWTEVGASPFLGAAGDGNYIEGTTDGAQHRWFSFEDIELGTDVIDYVQLWGYTDGPYDEGVDFDIYDTDFNWLGSLYATGAGPEWVTPRWLDPGERTSDIVPALLTEEGLNDFQVLAYFYDPGAAGGPGNILDALRLEVTYLAGRVALPVTPPEFVVQPNEVLEFSLCLWLLEPQDVGTYTCTITVYYSYLGNFFNPAEKKVVTSSWSVR